MNKTVKNHLLGDIIIFLFSITISFASITLLNDGPALPLDSKDLKRYKNMVITQILMSLTVKDDYEEAYNAVVN